MDLIRFIGQTGHPPFAADRKEAGYKADVPVLYHLLTGALLSWVDYDTLPSLRENSLNPRNLIIADGLTPWSIIHTEDERWPWRGVVLGIHLARLVSTLLSLGTIWVIYRAALNLISGPHLPVTSPQLQWWALGVSALIAFNPQFCFIASSVNDDNLLGLLMALATWSFVKARQVPYRWYPWATSGVCLGLALTTKYSMALVLLTIPFWLILCSRQIGLSPRAALGRFLVCVTAIILMSAWWFSFRILHFNRIEEIGLVPGVIAALADRADISAQRVASWFSTAQLSTPLHALNWFDWFVQVVISFWLPGAPLDHVEGLALSVIVVLLSTVAITGLPRQIITRSSYHAPSQNVANSPLPIAFGGRENWTLKWPLILFAVHVALLVVFPALRYYLSGNINESAQGRHILFPAAVPVGLLLATGLAAWFAPPKRLQVLFGTAGVLLCINLINFYRLILPAFPEPLPVRTTAEAAQQVASPIHLSFGDAVELLGYEVHQPNVFGALPVTLTWRSTGNSFEDFLTDLFLVGEDGAIYSRWLGHPAGGRYPTRAWQPGDVIRDDIWLVLTGLHAGSYRLCLRLLPAIASAHAEPTSGEGHCLTTLSLPDMPVALGKHVWQLSNGRSGTFDIWQSGRVDDPSPVFRYRSAIQISVDAQAFQGRSIAVTLVGPDGPEQTALFQTGNTYTFLVGARWSAGLYRVQLRSGGQIFVSEPVLEVRLRQRDFAVPPMQHVVNAHFGGEITLLGYDLPERKVQPGGTLPVTLYWRAEREVQGHYVVFNHLLGADSRQWGGRDRIPRDYYSTALWTAGEVVTDSYLLPVDAAAPPGVYHLDVGLYQVLAGQIFPLHLVDAEGKALDVNSVTLTAIKVGGAPPGVTVNAPSPEHPRTDNLGGLVTLIGYDLSTQPTTLEIVLYWHCDAPLPSDYTTFVHLVNTTATGQPDAARIVAQMDRPPTDGAYLTSLWDVGEVIRDEVVVPLPTNLASGDYSILVGLYDAVTGQRLAVMNDGKSEQLRDAVHLTTLHLPTGAAGEAQK